MKELRHLGIVLCISVVPVMIASFADITLSKIILMNCVFFPIESILASVICKYMGWDK